MTDLTCQEVLDFLDDYLDGGQAEAVRAHFKAHLERCPPCRDYLRSYADTQRMTRSLCEEAREGLPSDLPDELVRAIVDAMKRAG
ncbi:MAG: anti-sigma factor family protein [Planctomycetota bacterium]|jgi:predicted anti-sigma-YlaC factor YlaD